MARPLQVLSLASRLGALSVMPQVSANSSRFASRDAKAWMRPSHVHRVSDRAPRHSRELSDEDLDMEDVEDKLQDFIDKEKKRQRTVKYHILRRQMTPPGAPVRRLSWDAIEQIRYLKQEQPEEWTVERLAEGFSVTPDVIQRVLRSKFVPPPERKAKQDTQVMRRLGQQALSPGGTGQDRPRLPGHGAPAILPSGGKAGELAPVANQTLIPSGTKSSGSLVASASTLTPVATLPSLPSVSPAELSKHASLTTRSTEEDSATKNRALEEKEEEEEEEEESWDGWVLSEDELKELMLTAKHSPAVQVGNDFFDTEGNFLYRI
ncbi:neugrin [Myripristis murdjan]|uniref:Neugrin n=1 Tax=Myripristis murdjan TaxID=586833 RepID=A0A667WT52_9TELE|nr:neugrin [Myripristis murdjan]XP_029911716.1 neugrin [Myripristis murdjan]